MALSDDEKKAAPVDTNLETDGVESDSDRISQDAQAGVQKIEATTKVWTKTSLIVAYAMCVIPCLQPPPSSARSRS